ncbi:MAG: asparagine--tRNA ligase [Candidatus Tectomicrobia bacterium]|nr:asparagine--tRNA ligase [Candidatus Tectomicrobia bacterium]
MPNPEQAPRAWVHTIGRQVGEEVTMHGWLYNKRSSGKVQFLQLRDGTGIVQCVVVKNEVTPEVFALCDSLQQESAISVTGEVRVDSRSPLGYELGARNVVLHHAADDYPISPKEHGVAFLMDHRHLWLRSSRQHAILRIRAGLARACRDFFDSRNFTLLDAPIFTPAACEGTTTLFETDYFGGKAFLSQSGQLYMEAGAMAFGKVYCFGPTFRAEKSKTRRHLTEFWMIEPEVAYFDLEADMDLAEEFVVEIAQRMRREFEPELTLIGRDLAVLDRVRKPLPRIRYDEAIELLRAKGCAVAWGDDFGGDEETLISQEFDRPVIIHRYPIHRKAFYMKQDPADARLALCMDMLASDGYGEIVGGGQREDNLAALERKIAAHGLPKEAFSWYFDLRRYGSVPHAGFGLGLERTLAWICGLHHVRETIPFPRLMDRLSP